MSNPESTSPRQVTTRLGPLAVATAGSGPPAVLWHSLFVDSTTWSRLTPLLETERRLVLIDGPNHGGNPPLRRPFALEDCVGAALDVLDELRISGPVDWLGNAWGGHVGVMFAAAHPERCRTLTAIGAPIHAYSAADRRRTRLLSVLYLAAGARASVAVARRRPARPSSTGRGPRRGCDRGRRRSRGPNAAGCTTRSAG